MIGGEPSRLANHYTTAPPHIPPTFITFASISAPFQPRLHPQKFREVTEVEFFTPLQITETEDYEIHTLFMRPS